MPPIKITILGDYWDCQIYMGKLYLWKMNGDFCVVDWEKLVNHLFSDSRYELGYTCAFLDGSYLYNNSFDKLYKDLKIKQIIQERLGDLQRYNLVVCEVDLQKFKLFEIASPFKELPRDTDIYNKIIYSADDNGLWFAKIKCNSKGFIDKSAEKIWDCPLVSINASEYSQISLSAGSEGLFEHNPSSYSSYNKSQIVEDGIFKIAKGHSLFSNYSFLSIYNTSNIESSALALFTWEEKKVSENRKEDLSFNDEFKLKHSRTYKRNVDESKIFNENSGKEGLSWGAGNNIYKAHEGGVKIVNFNNYPDTKKNESYFTDLRTIELQSWKGKVINGGTAYFGLIIECENALVVARSDGGYENIEGPITKWRVYPRSLNYENQLHVIKDDRLEIYSFNHDYFVDQKEKELGLSYKLKNKNYRFNRK